MKFNLLMPMRAVKHYESWIEHGHLTDVAVLAEEAGFDGVAATDHPFPDEAWLSQGGHHSFDPFVALSFMAAATEHVRLITYVLVSGYRSPFVSAKALASLDRLSGGRVIAGMAAGYLQAEFDAVGARWDDRGPRLEAAIVAMRAAWSGESVDLSGPYPVHGHLQLPPPTQLGGPPVWIGGNSAAARRRAIEYGQGWMPLGQSAAMAAVTRTQPIEEIGQLRQLVHQTRARRAESSTQPLEICFAPFGDRTDMASWVRRTRQDIAAYEDAGVTWLTIEPHTRTLTEFRDAVGRFSTDVIGPSR